VPAATTIPSGNGLQTDELADPPLDPLGAKRADALRLLADSFLARHSDDCGSVADRFQVVVHMTPAFASTSGAEHVRLHDNHALALDTARRLGCDCSLVGFVEDGDGEPLSVGRKTRAIPPSLQRALKARDGGCRFPGCGRSGFTEGHHVKHWADGGETKLGNLVTLCRFHHRLIHEGGFGLHVVDDGAERDKFVFTRPDGTRVEANGRKCFRGSAPLRLAALNRDRGLAVDADTSRCGWRGERIDYGLAIEALVQRRDLAAAPQVPVRPGLRPPA
jgi:hypothetical protein